MKMMYANFFMPQFLGTFDWIYFVLQMHIAVQKILEFTTTGASVAFLWCTWASCKQQLESKVFIVLFS